MDKLWRERKVRRKAISISCIILLQSTFYDCWNNKEIAHSSIEAKSTQSWEDHFCLYYGPHFGHILPYYLWWSINCRSTTMLILFVAHHGVAVDEIRFDSGQTTCCAIGYSFCAHPNVSCNVWRVLFADTICVTFMIYTRMTLMSLTDFHMM